VQEAAAAHQIERVALEHQHRAHPGAARGLVFRPLPGVADRGDALVGRLLSTHQPTQHLDRVQQMLQLDVRELQHLHAQSAQPLAQVALLSARHHHHRVGAQRDHGLEARVEQAADGGHARQLGLLPRRVVVHPDELVAGAQRDEHRGQRGVERDDAPRRGGRRRGGQGEQGGQQEGGASLAHGTIG
jgi:hypothetical protein